MTIVLIAGSSGSGKSTLAQRIVQELGKGAAKLFQQDHYFATTFLPYGQRHDNSFEDGSGIDWERLQKDMEEKASGDNNNILVVEGHMLGAAIGMFRKFDASMVIAILSCDKELCKQRRLNRRDRSQEEWEELSTYIDQFVWPSFLETGMPTMDLLRTFAQDNPTTVHLLELSTDREDSLDSNVQAMVEIIHQLNKEDEITEEWPSLQNDNLQGFAQHHSLTIRLDHPPKGASFEICSVASLTPLDMVFLSQGAHDATGSSIWMGAYYLMEALAANATLTIETNKVLPLAACFHSKRVLELGCGTGVAGLSLLLSPQALPSHVCFTDNDEAVLELCQRNCDRNGFPMDSSTTCSFSLLEWGSVLEQNGDSSAFDTVLATDVLYDLSSLEPLLLTAEKSLQPLGTFVLAHVPRSCLPPESSQSATKGDYHASLEDHIVKVAGQHDFKLIAVVRPSQVIIQGGNNHTLKPLNEVSLKEMQDAGAAILVFRKEVVSAATTEELERALTQP